MSISVVREKLEQWGVWQRGIPVKGYGSVLGQIRGSTVKSAIITDEQALQIDRVLGVLKQTSQEQFFCVEGAYRYQLGVRAIGKKLGIGHQTVQRRITSAEQWLSVAFELEKIF